MSTEIETPVVTPEGGAGEGAAEQQPAFIEQWNGKFGTDFKAETDTIAFADTLNTENGTLKARIAELEARKLEYQSQASEQVDKFVARLKTEGVTDPVEVRRKVAEFINEAATDYKDMATNRPGDFLARQFERNGLTAQQSRIKVQDIEAGIRGRGEANGLEGTELDAYVRERMQIEAQDRLQGALDSQAKLDFKPAATKTPGELRDSFAKAANAFADGTRSLKVGTEEIPVSQEMMDGWWDNYLRSGAADKSMGLLADPTTTEGFNEFAQLTFLRHHFPAIIAAEREKARSEALAEFEKRVTRPNDGSGAGGGTDTEGMAMTRSEVKERLKDLPRDAFG